MTPGHWDILIHIILVYIKAEDGMWSPHQSLRDALVVVHSSTDSYSPRGDPGGVMSKLRRMKTLHQHLYATLNLLGCLRD